MPPAKSPTAEDANNITRGYKRLLQKVSTSSNDLGEALSSDLSDTKISDNLDRAEALFGAFSREGRNSVMRSPQGHHIKVTILVR